MCFTFCGGTGTDDTKRRQSLNSSINKNTLSKHPAGANAIISLNILLISKIISKLLDN